MTKFGSSITVFLPSFGREKERKGDREKPKCNECNAEIKLNRKVQMENDLSGGVSDPDGLNESKRSLSSMATKPSERLKVIDFGLAKELGLYADRIPITMCGTLEFMAPEVR